MSFHIYSGEVKGGKHINPTASFLPVAKARECDPFQDGSHANLPICMHETMSLLPIPFLEASAGIVD